MKGSRYIRLLLALFTSALGYLALSAQPHYSMQHSLSYKDGLYGAYPQQSLLAQDGSLWIYTDAALNRYDGDRFQPISLPPKQDPAQINGILAEDGAGRIWAGRFVYKATVKAQHSYSQTEIFICSPQTGQAVHFDSLLAPELGHSAAEVRHLFASEQAIYLLLGNGEVHTYTFEDGFRKILDGQGKRSIVAPGPGRSLWVQSTTALLRLGADGYMLDSIPVPCPAIALQPLPSGQLAVQFPHGIDHMGENVHQLIAKAGGGLSHLLQLASGAVIPVQQGIKLGISPNGGLHLITPDDWLVYTAKGEQAFSWKTFFPGQQHDILPTARKGEIFFDGYGVAYANFHSRVNVLLVQPSPFTTYKTTLGKSMRAFLELPDGELIASSYSGNIATQGIRPSPFPDSLDGPFLSTCSGKDGEIWVGGHFEKILVFDQQLRLLRQYDIPETSQAPIACLSLFSSSNGVIWAGAHNGLHYYDPKYDELRPCTAINDAFQLHNEQVRHITEHQGVLWLGTAKGLYSATLDGQPMAGSRPAIHATVNHSFWSSPDSCWVSTKEEGLLLWLPQQGKVIGFTREKTGLPDNTIYAVYEDQQGRLWLPTNLGLGWLSTANMEKGSFSTVSGLPSDEFNFTSSYRTEDGQVFLGGVNGVCSFDPGQNSFRPPSSEVKLSVAFVGRPDARGEITDATAGFVSSGELELSNATSTAAHITFSLASYLPKASYQYDYRLAGLSEDWQPMAGAKLVLSGLPYGSYVLQVRGRLNETWFESSHLAIPVRVRKPFYLMAWFWIAVPLALTGLGYGFSRLRLKHMRKQREILREEVARRTAEIQLKQQTILEQNQALQALNKAKDRMMSILGHEVRGNLFLIDQATAHLVKTLDSGQWEGAAKLAQQIQESTLLLFSTLEDLKTDYLSYGKQGVPATSAVDLHELAAQLLPILEGAAKAKQIELKVERSFAEAPMVRADPPSLAIALQNILVNALKFTPVKGEIEISYLVGQSRSAIRIFNSGEGLSEQQLAAIRQPGRNFSQLGTLGEVGTGLGLTFAHELISRQGGALHIDSSDGKGVGATIWLPSLSKREAQP